MRLPAILFVLTVLTTKLTMVIPGAAALAIAMEQGVFGLIIIFFLIFDVEDPVKPKQLGHFQTGNTGTHRNFYDGGTIVHAAAGAPGLYGKIYRAVDIADPSNP